MSIKHLTFKEYINSKEQLIDSLKNEPVGVQNYVVSNYCKLSIGESIKDKNIQLLKPNDNIQVEWNYSNKESPDCIAIIIEGKSHDMYWKNEKIATWIKKNTKDL